MAVRDDLLGASRLGGNDSALGPQPLHDDPAERFGDPRAMRQHVSIDEPRPGVAHMADKVNSMGDPELPCLASEALLVGILPKQSATDHVRLSPGVRERGSEG